MTTRQPAQNLQILSRLLDQALDTPTEMVELWLSGLEGGEQVLVPRLRGLLAKHRAGSCAAFMSASPRLDQAADAPTDQAGDLVGPYKLVREVGRGGMSTVWLAERTPADSSRVFALKLPRRVADEATSHRAACERDITALMQHPNVVRLQDAGTDRLNRPYLVLDYVAGQALDGYCADWQLGVAERLRLFLQLARAVAHVHSQGVVHRDLKPSNVLVDQSGQVQLIDFGIACRLPSGRAHNGAAEGERSLTPSYASLEQLQGLAPSFASDVYSLGVVLFELLTGLLPFQRRRGLLGAVEALGAEAKPPLASCTARDRTTAWRLRGRVDAILCKALAPEPEQRYGSAIALARDIEQYLGHRSRPSALAGPRRPRPLDRQVSFRTNVGWPFASATQQFKVRTRRQGAPRWF